MSNQRVPRRIFYATVVVPIALAALALVAQAFTWYSWNRVVHYQSPYLAELPPSPTTPRLTGRVVLVVVDGLRLDASREMPTLNALRQGGADFVSVTGQPSLSFPGWTALTTGAYQAVSGVTTNWYSGEVRADSIFARARAGGLRTAVAGLVGWKQLYGGLIDDANLAEKPGDYRDTAATVRTDDQIAAMAADLLRAGQSDLTVVHLMGPDHAGHGFGAAAPEYREMVAHADSLLASLLPLLDLSRDTLIVTADHGHLNRGGHGGWEFDVTHVPLVLAGRAVRPGAYGDTGQADVAPTVSALLGLSFPAHSGGVPLTRALDVPTATLAALDVAAAEQQVAFYDRAYAPVLGAPAFAEPALAAARADLATGDPVALEHFEGILRARADELSAARLDAERGRRLPLLALALLPAPVFYVYRRRLGAPLWRPALAALLGVGLYYASYFARGNSYSLSVFNSDRQVPSFLLGRLADGTVAMLAAALLLGILLRHETRAAMACGVLALSLWIFSAFVVQSAWQLWRWGLTYEWYLPDFQEGFKYFLDLVQLVPTGLLLLLAPVVARAGRGFSLRLGARRAARVAEAAGE